MDKSAIIKALRDGGQALSAGIADGAIGTNVDGIGSILRSAGMSIPDNPVGGSKWLREKGVVVDAPSNPVTETAYAAGFAPTQLMQLNQPAANYMAQSIKNMIAK